MSRATMTWPRSCRKLVAGTDEDPNKCLPPAAGRAFPRLQALSPAAGDTGSRAGAAQQGNPGVNSHCYFHIY